LPRHVEAELRDDVIHLRKIEVLAKREVARMCRSQDWLAHERTIAEMRVHDGRSSRRLSGGHELHSPKEQPKRLAWLLIDLAPSTYAVGAYHVKTIIAVSTPILSATRPKATRCRMGYAVISRPRFSDAAFAVGDEDAHVTLRIKY
jgi:hypothetical protein